MVSFRWIRTGLLLTLLLNVLLLLFHALLSSPSPAARERYITVDHDDAIVKEQIYRYFRSIVTSLQLHLNNNVQLLDARGLELGGINYSESTQLFLNSPNCDECLLGSKKRDLELSKGLWDKSRTFKIFPFIITSDKWSALSSWNVCLSTQCSVDLLFWVVDQVASWKGPISLSVFVPDVDYTVAVVMIQYMRICFPRVREQVSFHMVYPNVMPPRHIETELLEYDCQRPEDVNIELARLLRTKQLLQTLEIARYPQNLLRNVARQGCQSPYCFTPDIDMISIPSFSQEINQFVTRNEVDKCKKCAYIVPTYEISLNAPKKPSTKTELQSYLKEKLAQRFHIHVFANNQANSQLDEWENLEPGQHLEVAYNVTTWRTHWEPIYITKAAVPSFDERFIGYGFTRNSQVYEMRVAGYSWHVLDGAFLTHRGFQSKRTQSATRRRQIAENSARYNVFVRELFQRYGVQLNDEDGRKAMRSKARMSKGEQKTGVKKL